MSPRERTCRLQPRRHARRARLPLAGFIILAAGCGGSESAAPAQPAFPPATVKVAAARAMSLDDATEYVATLRSLQSTMVQPQIEGQITQIFVRSGQRVAAGAALMQIDARREQAAVSSGEAELAAREAAATYARSQAARARELFQAGGISKQELEQAETALQTAEAGLESLRAQVQERRVQLRYFTIQAPTAGEVGDIPVRVGYQVSSQTLLTTIDRNDVLEAYVPVPLARSGDLRIGLPLQIVGPDGAVQGATTISFVSPRVDEATQSVLAKGLVRNPSGVLRSSQSVRARIVWRSFQGLVIPILAVTRVNGQYFAYVAESAKNGLVARQRAVKLGPLVGDDYILLGGIEPNERIVVSGVQKLVDGAPIVAEAAEAGPGDPPKPKA